MECAKWLSMTHRRLFLQNVSSWNFIVQLDWLPEVLVMHGAHDTVRSWWACQKRCQRNDFATLRNTTGSTTSWIALRTSNMYLWKISKRKKRALHKVYICLASMNIISSSRNWIFVKIPKNGHQEMKVDRHDDDKIWIRNSVLGLLKTLKSKLKEEEDGEKRQKTCSTGSGGYMKSK